jgi:hypothetical protein
MCIPSIVRFAIDFDHELGGMAIEVTYICSGRLLTPELQVLRPLAELAPQEDLWKAHAATQLARSADGFARPT